MEVWVYLLGIESCFRYWCFLIQPNPISFLKAEENKTVESIIPEHKLTNKTKAEREKCHSPNSRSHTI